MTLTSAERTRHPARYARKDARTAIYRALYGEPMHPDPKSDPSQNESRKLPEDWSFAAVSRVWESLRAVAAFSPATEAALIRRLELLQSLGRKERAAR